MRASIFLPISAACLMVFAAATPAMAQANNNGPSVQIETTSAALIIGGQSGDGVLSLPNLGTNCTYPFKVSGIGGGLQVGISNVSAGGPVQNLTRLEDFPGAYTNVEGQSTLVVGGGAVEKHINNIFTKLGLAPGDRDHRRVLAVLRYLGTG